jgi:hypothetical protein
VILSAFEYSLDYDVNEGGTHGAKYDPDTLSGGPMWNDVLDVYAGTTDVATLQDPRLSPTNFKKRDDLPGHIFC